MADNETPAQNTTPTETYGVSETISGYTIESVTTTETPVVEQVHNQTNAVVKEIKYDTRKDLTITLRGATKPTASTFDDFTGTGVKWILDSVESAGTYNGLKRWNVRAHNFTNCNEVTVLS